MIFRELFRKACRRGGRLALAVAAATAVVVAFSGSAGAVYKGVNGSAQAPWAVVVNTKSSFWDCSGAIVSRHLVLTAKHCLGSGWTLGKTQYTVSTGGALVKTTPIWAGDWSRTTGKGLDLALLKSVGDFSSSPNVPSPLPLAPTTAVQTAEQGKGLTLFGWGDTHDEAKAKVVNGKVNWSGYTVGNPSHVQKTVNGSYSELATCPSDFHAVNTDPLCFKRNSGNVSRVQHGDSGAPWVAWYGGAWVGIAVHHSGTEAVFGPPEYSEGTSVADARAAILAAANAKRTEIMAPNPNTIVRDSKSGNAWLVGADYFRRSIPTGGDYQCFVGDGDPVVNAAFFDIRTIPEQVGQLAKCGSIPVVNGSFETDTFAFNGTLDLGGTNTLTGWTTLPNGTYPWGLPNTNYGNFGPTPYGNQWVIVGDYGEGGTWIEQTVNGLTPGHTYSLNFATASETTGGTEASLLGVSFPAGSSTSDVTIAAPPGQTTYWDTWAMSHVPFVATSSSVTFRLTGLIGPYDPGIDNVSITG